MRMAHTCVRVKNLAASLEFYSKSFGFEESSRRDFPEYKFTLVYLTLPGDDYPDNIGVISGVVGLAGGLGGFLMPIMFGALVDLTGVRSSAFMLMFGVVWVSLMWMYFTEVREMDAARGRKRVLTADVME